MRKLDVNTILKVKKLSGVPEYEQAFEMHAKLLRTGKDYPIIITRQLKHLITLIANFEADNGAIFLDLFIVRRKVIITNKMKLSGLTLEDLGKILHHKKDFLTQLLNGTRSFSSEDLTLIQRLLDIEEKYLFPEMK